MKNVFWGLLAIVFITMSSFTTNASFFAHTCYYKMYNSRGQYLGDWSLILPDNVPCTSTKAVNLAVASYNLYN